MGTPPVDLDSQALRPLRRAGEGLALACAAVSIAAAAVHAMRDAQPGWAALLVGAAGLTLAIWWWPTTAAQVTGCRWDEAGWHVRVGDDPQALNAQVTGILATRRYLLLRVQTRLAGGGRRDDLFLVDGDRLGDARWSRLRSTLRLNMPHAAPVT
jgi:hypothetical protein